VGRRPRFADRQQYSQQGRILTVKPSAAIAAKAPIDRSTARWWAGTSNRSPVLQKIRI